VQGQFAGGAPPVLSALTPRQSVAAGATISWTVQALVLQSEAPAAGQTVTWTGNGSGIVPVGSSATTNAAGIATETLTVGPLAEGALATATACVNGTGQCVTFSALGARTEFAVLEAVSGTSQTLSVADTPAPIVLRLLDMDGNPMAAGEVALYESVYAWAPACGAHSVCAPAALLATQTATTTSALDGTVSFAPATLPGVATDLVGLATSGNTATVNIGIAQHP
jgi:hypothetical protein